MKTKIFDRPIAFQRPFVELTGSITAALFLSQAYYWSSRTTLGDGWFYKTQKEWQEETGLTRNELDSARRNCAKYITTELRGSPAVTHYFVDVDKIHADCGVQIAENQQTRLLKTSKLVCGKPANSLYTENTTENTTEKNAHYLLNLPPEDVKLFTEKYSCTQAQVATKAEQIILYCKSKGKTYKDYKATLQNWLLRDYGLRKQNKKPANLKPY